MRDREEKKKSGIFYITSLALFFVAQCNLHADRVITSVATITANNPTNATVSVNVFGDYTAGLGPPPPQPVSTFGLTLTITGVSPTISSPSFVPGSQWFALDDKLAPTIAGNTVTFQANELGPAVNVDISGAGQVPQNLIGTFSFTVNKTGAPQDFAITPSAAAALGGQVGFGIPGSGFFSGGALVYVPITTTYTLPTDTTNGTGTIAAEITAVPEPSSFALLGLVACGYMLRRRRSVKAA